MNGIWAIELAEPLGGQDILQESDDLLWPQIPLNARIRRLHVGGHVFEGADYFGFQRFAAVFQGGQYQQMAGFQVLMRSEVVVTVWEIQNGRCTTKLVPVNDITYNRELWRRGTGRGE